MATESKWKCPKWRGSGILLLNYAPCTGLQNYSSKEFSKSWPPTWPRERTQIHQDHGGIVIPDFPPNFEYLIYL